MGWQRVKQAAAVAHNLWILTSARELKDVVVVHPGEIFGWGDEARPERILNDKILETDRVHLRAPYAARLASIIEDLVRKLTNQESLGKMVGRVGGGCFADVQRAVEATEAPTGCPRVGGLPGAGHR